MSRNIRPDYLVCTDGTSNKFYVTVDFGDGKGLTGYGKNEGGAAGRWSELSDTEVRSKLREKQKTYRTTSHRDIPTGALRQMIHLISQHFSAQASIGADGSVDVNVGMAPPRPIAAAPKRAKSHDRIKVWL